MTVRRAQPETLSMFLRCQSRREFLLHSQIHSFCILESAEALLLKPLMLRWALLCPAPGAEVGTTVSPCSCAGVLLILQELAEGTGGPNIMLVHRDYCFLCNSETVIQLTVLCLAERSQINYYCPPATLECWEQIKTQATEGRFLVVCILSVLSPLLIFSSFLKKPLCREYYLIWFCAYSKKCNHISPCKVYFFFPSCS